MIVNANHNHAFAAVHEVSHQLVVLKLKVHSVSDGPPEGRSL